MESLKAKSLKKPCRMTDMKWKLKKERPLSWSAISSFEYNPEQWYQNYVIGNKEEPNAMMRFGKEMGERFAAEPHFLPQLPRGELYEYELRAVFGKIPLIGFIDCYTPHTLGDEYKTGIKPWTQKRADEHGQLDMYALLLWLQEKVRPEEVKWRLSWLPTKETGDFRITFANPHDPEVITFETKRTMKHVLAFGKRINETVKLMEEYASNHA